MFMIFLQNFTNYFFVLENDEQYLRGLVIKFICYGYETFAYYYFPLPVDNYKKNPVSQKMFYFRRILIIQIAP